MEKLTEKIPYRKTVWLFGFVKTTLSGAFISIGVVLITDSLTKNPVRFGGHNLSLLIGIFFIAMAIWIIITIDKWKEKKKKEELDAIDLKIKEQSLSVFNDLDKFSREIAKEMVEEELQKIQCENTKRD